MKVFSFQAPIGSCGPWAIASCRPDRVTTPRPRERSRILKKLPGSAGWGEMEGGPTTLPSNSRLDEIARDKGVGIVDLEPRSTATSSPSTKLTPSPRKLIPIPSSPPQDAGTRRWNESN